MVTKRNKIVYYNNTSKLKGFTLIELLAVIVILAVIALITTPIILNVIEDAKKKSAIDSAYGYIKAIELNNSLADVNSKYRKISSGDVKAINNLVKLKGTKPTSGLVNIKKLGVSDASLCISGYNVSYKKNKAQIDSKCEGQVTNIIFESNPELGIWSKDKKVTIKFITEKIKKPNYYVMSSTDTSLNKEVLSCGNDVIPSECKDATKKIKANTWYRYKDEEFLLKDDTTLIAAIFDGNSYITSVSQTIGTFDKKAPECEIKVSDYKTKSVTVKAECTDEESGIKEYSYKIGDEEYINKDINTHKFDSIRISEIKVKVTDNADNNKVYEISEEEKERIYVGIYNILNKKYSDLNDNSFLYAYPIGSIYKTTSDDESTIEKMHSKYGGTWEVYGENRVLRGTIETVSKTDGSNSIKLTSSQIPSLNASGTKGAKTVNTTSTGSGYSLGYTYANRGVANSGTHGHGFVQGGSAFLVAANTNVSTTNGLRFRNGAGWWHEYTIDCSLVANSGNHTHNISDKYVNSVGGIGAHTHSFTLPAQTITSTYTNSNQSNVNVSDSYITVYMYRRVS